MNIDPNNLQKLGNTPQEQLHAINIEFERRVATLTTVYNESVARFTQNQPSNPSPSQFSCFQRKKNEMRNQKETAHMNLLEERDGLSRRVIDNFVRQSEIGINALLMTANNPPPFVQLQSHPALTENAVARPVNNLAPTAPAIQAVQTAPILPTPQEVLARAATMSLFEKEAYINEKFDLFIKNKKPKEAYDLILGSSWNLETDHKVIRVLDLYIEQKNPRDALQILSTTRYIILQKSEYLQKVKDLEKSLK